MSTTVSQVLKVPSTELIIRNNIKMSKAKKVLSCVLLSTSVESSENLNQPPITVSCQSKVT